MHDVVLYPHQVDILQDIDQTIAGGDHHLIAQACTGFGKTVIGATLIQRNLNEGKRTIFTVPRLSLINQTVDRFKSQGIHRVGVIQANHELTDWNQPVQVASVQTMMRRNMPPADMVIIDEVHLWFKQYAAWLAGAWRDIPVIGLSATPWTRGLAKYFSKLVIGAKTEQMITGKYLCPFKVYVPASPDLQGVRTFAGDFHEGDLGKAMNKTPLIADIVSTWLLRAEGRPTICFCVDRLHAQHVQLMFQEAEVSCGYVDCFTPVEEREAIERQFRSGELKIVCNVGVLTTGIDWTHISCIIMARPTKSEILFVQSIGRGLRPDAGKADLLILDHSDNHYRFGYVTEVHHEHLDDGKPKPKAPPRAIESLPKKCVKCTFLKPPKTLICPACGFCPKPANKTSCEAGELIELDGRRKGKAIAEGERLAFFGELRGLGRDRGYKEGWAAANFKERFGVWPDWKWKNNAPLRPSHATISWVKSRQIAYAKRRA